MLEGLQQVDILGVGVHPDDVELSSVGTLLRHRVMGYSVGLLDLTRGEMGSRGSAEIRAIEAEKSRQIIGAAFRVNLEMADVFFTHNEENLRSIIRVLRASKPKIVLANATSDRHPDHGRASKLVSDACFYSGLVKIETYDSEGKSQEPWRPDAVYHYIQDRNLKPDFVVDITDYIDAKVKCIQAFSTQFFVPGTEDNEPETPISSKLFFDYLMSKNRVYGRDINAAYVEAFTVERTMGVNNLFDLK
jgi:N-acetylglucosamine malate deacetylase 1